MKRIIRDIKKMMVIISILLMLVCNLNIDIYNLDVHASTKTNVSNLSPVDSTYTFIKSVEGYASECFWDVKQWTIGYGNKCPYAHTSNGVRGQKGGHTISEAEARNLFSSKLSGYVNTLKSNCSGLSMTQNQFDALLSATYNHGNVNNCPLKYYLQGKLTESEARTQYYEWYINKGTADEKGLRNRRKKEADLFFKDEPDPNPPTYSNLTTNKTMIAIGEEITFTASSDLATGYTIGVDNKNGRCITQEMSNGQLTLTFNEAGSYGAYVTSYNSVGYVDSNWISFIVYDTTPMSSELLADKYIAKVGEEITFTASSDLASAYWIGIDNTSGRYLTQEMPNGQLTLTFNEAGSYGAYVTSLNSLGYVDSQWINFTIYDSAPTYSILEANKVKIAIGEEITFTASSDLASAYWIGIDNETERYITQEMYNGKLTLTFDKAGNYGAYVTSLNALGYTDSAWINFTVYSSAVTKSELCADKSMIAVGEEITFIASSDWASEYWIGIDNKDGRYLTQNMPDGYLSVTFDTPGEYSAYVTSSNRFGGKDSMLIKFVVSSSIKGDVNNDGIVTIADAIMLQKWLLGVPNIELVNWNVADLCEDGVLNVFDLCLLKKMLVNK
ncbi:MAG: glycoside hydrolase family protein [Ruminococcus sp.]|nr:glycoside hydrolase family protein [Ruminococcus sp.]